MWIVLASIIAATCLAPNKAETSGEEVATTSGAVRGILRTTTTGSVNAFFGIPFAEPPIGELRFKKPRPKKPWEGVQNATSLPPFCPQSAAQVNEYFKITEADPMSEDCLFLNVFVPVRNNGSDLKPVVVYIHGGAFTFGGVSMKIFDSSELAARGDLVVVTISYRLGPLGFLDMGVEDAPGNMGLYDQLLALHWVRDNARFFGGDADKVTIMGQSAGAISVGFHLVSPKSKGLFRRAIMQSGSPFSSPFVMNKMQAARKAASFVTYLDCGNGDDGSRQLNSEDIVACLRSKDFRDILNAAESLNSLGLDGFFPVIGEEFLPEKPGAALSRVALNAHEILVSVCEAEGEFLVHYMLTKIHNVGDISLLTKRHMKLLLRILLTAMTSADPKQIIGHYFDHVSSENGTEVAYAASNLLGDFMLLCPTLGFAKRLSSRQRTSVHAFLFSKQLSFVGWPEWIRPTHADDVFFSLGSALSLDGNPSDSDVKATEKLVNVISTFSRTGVPQVINGTNWPKFNEDQQYLHIGDGTAVPGKHLRQSSCDFWNRILPYE